MLADSFGRPLRFLLATAQSHDILAAPKLLQGYTAEAVLADRAYDANALRSLIAESAPRRSSHPLAPDHSRSLMMRSSTDAETASRYDHRAIHFLAFIQLAAAMIWKR